jgi:DNA repair photolyase
VFAMRPLPAYNARMVTEIQARVLLSSSPKPDPWFGIRYTMNLYRGCQHQCIYCDSRSECYRIENFADIQVKVNALDLLRKELPRKRVKGTIGTGSMNDPYMPIEAERNLTGRALDIIAQHQFPVHIITKSDLVLRDLATLQTIGQVYAAVSFTITTADDDLGQRLEPGAPKVSQRFAALKELAAHGILTGVALMPVLPFIEDTAENIRAIVERAHDAGARYILPAFGMTLRDRQRDYYYAKLDRLFPGLRPRYERAFGQRYSVGSPHAKRLDQLCRELCERLGLARRMPFYQPPTQLPLL